MKENASFLYSLVQKHRFKVTIDLLPEANNVKSSYKLNEVL